MKTTKHSLRTVLLIYFLALIVPLLVVTVIVISNRAADIVLQKADEAAFNGISQARLNVDDRLGASEGIFNALVLNRDLEDLLNRRLDINTTSDFYQAQTMSQQLSTLQRSYSAIDSIYIYDLNDDCLYLSNGTVLLHSDFTNSKIYQDSVATGQFGQWLLNDNSDHLTWLSGKNYLTYTLPLKRIRTGQVLGYLFISVSGKEIDRYISEIQFENTHGTFVTTPAGALISETFSGLFGEQAESGELSGALRAAALNGTGRMRQYLPKSDAYLYVAISPDTGLYYSSFIPNANLKREIAAIHKSAMAISIPAILLAILLSVLFTRRIYHPVQCLVQAMDSFRITGSKSDILIEETRNDEFGRLYSSYNHMVVTNRDLLNRLILEEKKQKKMQIRLLQEKINPHFLYNCLNSIYCQAELCGIEEIKELAFSLINFFRLNLSGGSDSITVENMLLHLEYYIRIQNIRYKERYHLEVHADPDLLVIEVPKLLVQPLVENAVQHGLQDVPNPPAVEVSVYRKDTYMVIVVEDRGSGITPDRLAEIQRMLSENQEIPDKRSADAFALINIQQRLRLYYGDKAGLEIFSEPGCGTVVEMRLPLKEGDSDHV